MRALESGAGAARWLAAACAFACACRGTPRIEWDSPESIYTRLGDQQIARLAEARAALERGETPRAYELVQAISIQCPDHIGVGALRQEIELLLLAAGFAVPGLPALDSPAGSAASGDAGAGAAPGATGAGAAPGTTGAAASRAQSEAPEETLARAWRARVGAGNPEPDGEFFSATARPSELVLAARAETHAARARALLQGALSLDPQAAWAHYGMAHWAVVDFDFTTAEAALARAVELDPGLLPARRLEAHLAERSGDAERASALLEGWLERAEHDPLVARWELADAWYDRALLAIAADELGDARDYMKAAMRAGGPSLPRAEQVAAVLADEDGDPIEALRAARLAEQAAPEDALPLVQQALLYELRLGDPARAAESWSRTLALAEAKAAGSPVQEGGSLGWVGLRLMAQARLARLRLELAATGETSAPTGEPAQGRP